MSKQVEKNRLKPSPKRDHRLSFLKDVLRRIIPCESEKILITNVNQYGPAGYCLSLSPSSISYIKGTQVQRLHIEFNLSTGKLHINKKESTLNQLSRLLQLINEVFIDLNQKKAILLKDKLVETPS